MSTILDALRKVQRERSAQKPPADLRGSVTSETPSPARRRRRRSSRWIAVLGLLLAVGAAGSWLLYSSGRIDTWLAGSAGQESLEAQAELDDLDLGPETLDEEPAVEQSEPVATEAPPPPRPLPAPAETAELAVERARLEAALANARAAQEAQREAERAQAEQIQAAATPPSPPAPQIQAPPPPAPAQPAQRKAVVAKPARTASAPRPSPEPGEASAPIQSAFPDVAVVSIRWHPTPERRVASLRFERQNVPEAHEGDIVAGVRVHRIDPGAVELRVGSATRTISPGP